jgi:hypothetical protein
METGNLWR